jgi:hypothetical protein
MGRMRVPLPPLRIKPFIFFLLFSYTFAEVANFGFSIRYLAALLVLIAAAIANHCQKSHGNNAPIEPVAPVLAIVRI